MSDINQNGFPEFAISAFYCPTTQYDPKRCGPNDMVLHFYEIRGNSVKHLTGDLPGIISPYQVIHSKENLSIYVTDFSYPYINSDIADSYWVYQWTGTIYKDVTLQHGDEYKLSAEAYIANVLSEYGTPLTETNSLRIALKMLTASSIYRRIGMHDKAKALLLELTDPTNWPGTSPRYSCWLEIFRAQTQFELEKQMSFSFPVYSRFDDLSFSVKQFLREYPEMIGYDLSTCQVMYP